MVCFVIDFVKENFICCYTGHDSNLCTLPKLALILVCSVLVLDEMDQLDSKNQEVLYTMFEWPSMAKSRLVLVGEYDK